MPVSYEKKSLLHSTNLKVECTSQSALNARAALLHTFTLTKQDDSHENL